MDFNGIVYESDSLQHYGVLGMKWGHRKNKRVSYRTLKKRKKQLYNEGKEQFSNSKLGKEYGALLKKDAARFTPGNNHNMSNKDYNREIDLSMQEFDYANHYANQKLKQEYENARMSKRARRKFI